MDIDNEDGLKIVVVGESGVGKTSIVSRFVFNTFDEEVHTSLASYYSSKILKFSDGNILKFNLWDTAGQEKFRSITQLFYKDAKVAILVYDITRQNSYDELIDYWFNKVKENTSPDAIIVLAANKSDLIEKEEVNENNARKFAEEMKIDFFSISAKDNLRIEDLFIQIAKRYTGTEDFRFLDLEEESKMKEDKNKVNNSGKKKIDKSSSVKLKASNKNKKKKCC